MPTKAKAKKPAKTVKSSRRERQQGTASDKVVALVKDIVSQTEHHQNPTLNIPVRSLSNVNFNRKKGIIQMGDARAKRPFFDLGNAKRFMQSILMGSELKKLVDQNKTTSIRDMFYRCKHTIEGTRENTFEEQSESDPIIEDLEVTLDALREELHVFAEPKGAMVGPMTLVDKGDTIDLARMGSGGWAVPSIVEEDVIQFGKCTAKYLLLIEKGAVWKRFNEDRYWERHKCLIMHGGGQPPRGVRRLCHRLVSELNLPLFVLVDNDPWGYYIYSVVKQGSINLAYESLRMAVPSARFIGMSSYDAKRFDVSESVTIILADTDRSRAKEILSYPWFAKPEWQREIKHMLSTGVKLELEALSNKDFSFITEEYLPRKLKKKQWLD